MFKKTKKRLSILIVIAMMLSMFAGIASAAPVAPYTVFSSGFTTVTTGENKLGGTLTVAERISTLGDEGWGRTGTVYITVQLPDGVTFNVRPTSDDILEYVSAGAAFHAATDSMLRVAVDPDDYQSVTFYFNEEDFSALDIATDVSGDIKAAVEVQKVIDNAVQWIENESRTIARVAAKDVKVTAGTPTRVQMGTNRKAAKITIAEGLAGSFKTNEDIRLEIVTTGVTFYNYAPTFSQSQLPGATVVQELYNSGKELRINTGTQSAIFAGKLEITPFLNVNPTVTGDIQIRVRSATAGSDVPTTTLVVATLGSTAAELDAAINTTGTIYAGHEAKVVGTSSTKPAQFEIAAVGGALPQPRIVILELSEGVEFDEDDPFTVQRKSGTSWAVVEPDINLYSDNTKAWFQTEDWSAATALRIKDIKVIAAGDAKAGDISVKVSGSLGAEGNVVIGKVAKPFTATSEIVRLSYPGMDQAASDIIITETAKGTIVDGKLELELPTGVSFTSNSRVRVTEGDLSLGTTTYANGKVTIVVSAKSTTPSTITIDRIKYDVSRNALEGNVNVTINGLDGSWVDSETIATVANARVGTVAGNTVFTIGSTSYVVDGKTFTMDVSPFIKDGRTLLPLRFAADAVGTEEILWDSVRKTVTLIRGDRVVQVTVGSTTMLINGAAITMDIAPVIVDGRTMLPIRWVGMALRANVDWDADAKTVTVTPY